jgi:hypothetical protein
MLIQHVEEREACLGAVKVSCLGHTEALHLRLLQAKIFTSVAMFLKEGQCY